MNGQINIYAGYHKALRKVLYDIAVDLGRLDTESRDDIARLQSRISEAVDALRSHSAHEDEYVHPLLSGWDRLSSLEADHVLLEGQIERIEQRCDALQTAAPQERESLADDIYRSWNVFVSAYIAHLDFEETHVLQRLWATVETNRLLEAHRLIVEAQSPSEAERAVRWMCDAESPRGVAELMERVNARAHAR